MDRVDSAGQVRDQRHVSIVLKVSGELLHCIEEIGHFSILEFFRQDLS